MAESKAKRKQRALEIVKLLAKEYPDAECALHHRSAFELLIATILSAQTTDEKVNEVTDDLFKTHNRPEHFATEDPAKLEQILRPTGFFRNKTKSVIGASKMLLEDFGGEVPRTMEELIRLPGVSRKTASVVLGVSFGIAEGVVVDTHVARIAVRLGLTPVQTTKTVSAEKIEKDLMELLPREEWISFSHRIIWHGRRVCTARKPLHDQCVLEPLCPKIGTPEQRRL
ncbi:MAG: endonuclease III [Armatimonadia bacterium]